MVGASITLTHSFKTIPWTIIGFNHDNTTYTFDLRSNINMYDRQYGNQNYTNATNVRSQINAMVSGFSSDIQDRLQTMSVQSQQSSGLITVNDKAKLLSLTEMGISGGDGHPGVEGSPYSNYFTTGRSTGQTYSDLIINKYGYPTRSRDTRNSSNIWVINSDGSVIGNGVTGTYPLLPVIRIGIPA